MRKIFFHFIIILLSTVLFFQSAFSLQAASAASSSVSSERSLKKSLPFAVKFYKAKANDRLTKLARLYNISAKALYQINDPSIILSDGDKIRPGALVTVPKKALSAKVSKSFSEGLEQHKFDNLVQKAAQLLPSSHPLKAAAYSGAKQFAHQMSEKITQWLGQYATARVAFGVNHKFSFYSDIDILLPLLDKKGTLLFTQASFTKAPGGQQVNVGLGGRYMGLGAIWGVNGFLDYDIQNSYMRFGTGIEYWRDYLKLSLNGYFNADDWRDTNAKHYKVRSAKGYDLKGDFFVPFFPEIGFAFAYEKYFGTIALNGGTDDGTFVIDPHGLTFGINYTPIPLLTFSLEQKFAGSFIEKKIESNTKLSLQAIYRLGVPFHAQLNRNNVDQIRKISTSRYDLVQRNNNIVLEYKKNITVKLRPYISGISGDSEALFTHNAGLDSSFRISWQGEELLRHRNGSLSSACFDVTRLGECEVILPVYDNNGTNNYDLSFVLYNNKNQELAKQSTHLVVKPAFEAFQVEENYSVKFTPKDFILFQGEGHDLTIHITTDGGQDAKISADSLKISCTNAEGESLKLDDITGSQGHYRSFIHAGSKVSDYKIVLLYGPEQKNIGSTFVKVVKKESPEKAFKLSLAADKQNIAYKDEKGARLTLKIEDENGTAVQGLDKRIFFHIENEKKEGELVSLPSPMSSKIKGEYFYSLKGLAPGSYKIYPVLEDQEGEKIDFPESFLKFHFADAPKIEKYSLEVEHSHLYQQEANGSIGKTKITFLAIDALGDFVNITKDVHFIIKDAQDKEVLRLKAQKEGAHYEAYLQAKDFGSLEAQLDPYNYKILPYSSDLNIPKDVSKTVAVYSILPIKEGLDAQLTAEKGHLYFHEDTKLQLLLKDKRTGAAFEAKAKDIKFSIEPKSESKGATDSGKITEVVIKDPGLYEANFHAGAQAQEYKITVFYENLAIASTVIHVYNPSLSGDKSRLIAENDGSSINDKKGIKLIFSARDGRDTALLHMVDKLYFVITDGHGREDSYKILSPLREEAPGDYAQSILAYDSGIYKVVPYVKQEHGKAIALQHLAITINFSSAGLPLKGKVTVTPKDIWQIEKAQSDKPNVAHILFNSHNEEGHFHSLGTKIDFLLKDASGHLLEKIEAKKVKDGYEAEFSANTLKKLDYEPSGHQFTLIPFVAGLEFPNSMETSLTIHTDLPSVEDLEASFTADKEKIYHQEHTDITLALKEKGNGKAVDIPLEYVSFVIVKQPSLSKEGRSLEHACLSDVSRIGAGVYKAKFYAKNASGDYAIEAFYNKHSFGHLLIRVGDPFIDENYSDFSADKTHVRYLDEKGICLRFVAKDGLERPISGLQSYLSFLIKEKGGTKGRLSFASALTESKEEKGVYYQKVRSDRPAIYDITPVINRGRDRIVLNEKTITLNFEALKLRANQIAMSAQPEEIYQSEVSGPQSTKIHLKMPANMVALFGKNLPDIHFILYDEKGEEAHKLKAHYDGNGCYSAPFSASLAGDLKYKPDPYVYSIEPKAENIEFAPETSIKLKIYPELPSAKDVELELILSKSKIFRQEHVPLRLYLRNKKTDEYFDVPLHILRIEILSLEKGDGATISALKHVSRGEYSADFYTGETVKTYVLRAYYGNDLYAETKAQLRLSHDKVYLEIHPHEPIDLLYGQELFLDLRAYNKDTGAPAEVPLEDLKFDIEEDSQPHPDMKAHTVHGYEPYISELWRDNRGVYRAVLTAGQREGTYKLLATYQGFLLDKIPVKIERPVGPPPSYMHFKISLKDNALHKEITGDPLRVSKGRELLLNIILTDKYHNPYDVSFLDRIKIRFVANSGHETAHLGAVRYIGRGRYVADFSSGERASSYTIITYYDNEEISRTQVQVVE